MLLSMSDLLLCKLASLIRCLSCTKSGPPGWLAGTNTPANPCHGRVLSQHCHQTSRHQLKNKKNRRGQHKHSCKVLLQDLWVLGAAPWHADQSLRSYTCKASCGCSCTCSAGTRVPQQIPCRPPHHFRSPSGRSPKHTRVTRQSLNSHTVTQSLILVRLLRI